MDLKALLTAFLAHKALLSEEFATKCEAVLAALDSNTAVSDDDLLAVKAGVAEEGKRILGDSTADDALEAVAAAKAVKEAVATELVARAADDEARQKKADDLLAELEDPAEEPAEEAKVEEAVAEAPAAPAPEPVVETVEEPEPVAASAPRIARISNVNARRPASMIEPPKVEMTPVEQLSLVASAGSGLPAGKVITGPEEIAQAFETMWKNQLRGVRVADGVTEKLVLGSQSHQFPAERRYDNMDDIIGNDRIGQGVYDLIDAQNAAEEIEAIVASGGNCFPLNTDPSIKTYGVKDRPVRDRMMVRMQAPRGGVKSTPPLSIAAAGIGTGNSFWSQANDVALNNPATKPYTTIVCPDTPRTDLTYAVVSRLRFGNFNQRFYPELIAAWWDQMQVLQARASERKLLVEGPGKVVSAGGYAKHVTAGVDQLGCSVQIMSLLDRAQAILRQSRRLGDRLNLQYAAPFWLWDMIRTDIARTAYGTADERFAVADADINRWFATRGITPVPLMEGESSSFEFTIQSNSGELKGWPTGGIPTYLTIPGDWQSLDSGTWDFGLTRDSTLNNTNDVEMFVEATEGSHFTGLESWRLLIDICPSGAVSAPIAYNPCTTGS